MSIELKIKAKHLALEPAIIRREEQKILKQFRWAMETYQVYYPEDHSVTANLLRKYNCLSEHRKWNVRNEARATNLARAYISGLPYTSVEQKRKPENEYKFKTRIIPRVVAMVQKYGTLEQSIEDWSKID